MNGLKMRLKVILLFLALTASVLGISSADCLEEPAETAGNGNIFPVGQPVQDNAPYARPFENTGDTPLGIIFHHWQGFALKGDQSYILRVSIESVRPVGPVDVRKLLASNKTLEEIGREILVEEGNATYRGHLRLGDSNYWLTNIEVKLARSNLTLNADLNEPLENHAASNSTDNVGRITVNTTSYESERKGQGKLVIFKGQLIGSYQVLLDMLH